jgi:sulfate permease, SulP family
VDPDGTTCLYSVSGELFFASDQELIDAFHYTEDPPNVVIDFSRPHLEYRHGDSNPGFRRERAVS